MKGIAMSAAPQGHSRPGRGSSLRDAVPQPVRDGMGASDPGPRNLERDRQNPDLLFPPRTDHGNVPNLKFSFSDAHNRVQNGGWAREVTRRELPVATTLAGVNMRLTAGGVRELHWHKASEWAYMLYGRARITAVDQDGRTFVDDVGVGDLWFFPAGIPHSIQGLPDDGAEFLLVFDDGNFSEDETFSIADWVAHTPRAVLAKNFGVAEADFEGIPEGERYIFQGSVPGPLKADRVASPAGRAPRPFSHRLHAQRPLESSGGRVRIADASNFRITTTSAALVDVEPGGLRELHWHPTIDEWQYYIEGRGRMTVFASTARARTFDVQAGDVGYVPFAMGHYVENIGDGPLRFLEMFKHDRFADISLNQWMALSPPQLIREHLHLNDRVMRHLRKEKRPVVR
jgi:oxalate decarboxylase